MLMFSDNEMLKEAVMTDDSRGGAPADPAFQVAWDEFEEALAGYLSTMVDGDDHLIVELPGDERTGTAPYVQFASFGDGTRLRAEVSGNCFLGPDYVLDDAEEALLRRVGFAVDTSEGAQAGNWYVERPVVETPAVAQLAVLALQEVLGVTHPHLLTHQAWGPAADGVAALGLCSSSDVPVEKAPIEKTTEKATEKATRRRTAYRPKNRQRLIKLVGRVLDEKYDGCPEPDDDGDYGVRHMGQPVWVRVREDQPAVEIFARVTHGVRSRRGTAVEVGLLNRDHLWLKWELRGRDVWQKLVIPGFPFVPEHLDGMLDVFMDAMTSTRDDLALRVGGRTA